MQESCIIHRKLENVYIMHGNLGPLFLSRLAFSLISCAKPFFPEQKLLPLNALVMLFFFLGLSSNMPVNAYAFMAAWAIEVCLQVEKKVNACTRGSNTAVA